MAVVCMAADFNPKPNHCRVYKQDPSFFIFVLTLNPPRALFLKHALHVSSSRYHCLARAISFACVWVCSQLIAVSTPLAMQGPTMHPPLPPLVQRRYTADDLNAMSLKFLKVQIMLYFASKHLLKLDEEQELCRLHGLPQARE